MTLGQRVCVLRAGRLQQVDTPQALFRAPVNLFVAGFIGSPAMNFSTAELVRDGEPTVVFAGHRLTVPGELIRMRPGLDSYFGRQLILGVRPSDFEDARLAEAAWPRIQVTANVTEELGSEVLVLFTIDAPPVQHASLSAVMAGAEEEEGVMPITGHKAMWTARVASRSGIRPGQQPELAVDTSNLQFFDAETGLSIGHTALVTSSA
jgi:multiple sugar transport system ATP-binding protein